MAEHTSQITPGPWKKNGSGIMAEPYQGRRDRRYRKHLATMRADATEADARLIAAAPDMLEALQKMFNALCGDPPDNGPQKDIIGDDTIYRLDGQAMYHAINACRAAIARATSD